MPNGIQPSININWVLTADEKLVITIDVSKAAIDAAPESSTGRTRLVATNGSRNIHLPAHHSKAMMLSLRLMVK